MPGNRVRITAETVDKASSPLDRIKDRFEGLQKQSVKGFGIGVGAAVTTKALEGVAGAADAALSAVVDFAAESVRKAIDEEAGIGRLTQAIKANVAGWDGNTKAMEDVIAEREKLAFSDGEQRDSLALLVARTHDVTKALDLERLAMDVARLKGIDLATASELVGKVYGGNVAILQRYGFAVKKGATATEALAGLQAAASGQAVAFSNTTAGAMQSVQVEIDDLQETIGTELLPVIRDVSKWARDDGVPALKAVVETLGQVGDVAHTAELGLAFLEDPAGFAAFEQHTKDLQSQVDQARATMASMGIDWHKLEANEKASAAALGAATVATDGLTGANQGLHHAYAPVIVDLRTMKQKLDDATTAIEDDMFAVDEAKRSLHEYGDALKDDEEHLRKLEAIKHPTRAQREDINHTKDAIDEDKKAIIENSLKLLSMGKITFPNLIKRLQGIGLNINADTAAARQLRTLLYQIDSAAGGRAGGGGARGGGAGGTGVHRAPPPPDNGHGNAAGGPVAANMPRLVGEKGPELFTPESNGMITPNSNTMLAAGAKPSAAGVTIHIGTIALNGIGSDVSPAAAEHFGRRVVAEVAANFQQGAARRGLSVAVRP